MDSRPISKPPIIDLDALEGSVPYDNDDGDDDDVQIISAQVDFGIVTCQVRGMQSAMLKGRTMWLLVFYFSISWHSNPFINTL